jgi:alpha/beta superfamily hydrolase
VGPGAKLPEGAKVVELGDATLLPGLIDAHVHLAAERSDDFRQDVLDALQKPAAERALQAAAWGERTLRAGFTTVRNLGDGDGAVLALRDAIATGKVDGPRIVDAGRSISATTGHMDARLGLREEVALVPAAAPGSSLFGVRHVPLGRVRGALLVCSPVLTDFGANYRREVELARRLAARGIAVQRYHPRGVGHSDGDRLDLTVESLVADAATALEHLSSWSGAVPTAVLGTRLSALAAAAVAGDRPLALWQPVTDVRSYLREGLRARSVHRLGHGAPPAGAVPDVAAELAEHGFADLLGIPVGPGLLAAGGLAGSPPARAGAGLREAVASGRGPVLLLQFGTAPELAPAYRSVVDAWTAAGRSVTATPCPSDETWWFVPDRSADSASVVDLTAYWVLGELDAEVPSPAPGAPDRQLRDDQVRLAPDVRSPAAPDRRLRDDQATEATAADESPVFVPSPAGDLLAVITAPTAPGPGDGRALVLLRGNGWRPSSGPRRSQVRLARRLAGAGFTGVRFSYHGVAESGGESEAVFPLDRPHVDDLAAVDGWVRAQGLQPVLVGNCFGARTALAHAARQPADRPVAGLVLVVPPVHDFEVVRRRDRRPLRRLLRRASPARLWEVLRDPARRRALGRTTRAVLDVAQERAAQVGGPTDGSAPWVSKRFVGQLEAVVRQRVPVLLVYGTDDSYGRDFATASSGALAPVLAAAENLVMVTTVAGRVHGLTSVATQDAVQDAVESWLRTALPPGPQR